MTNHNLKDHLAWLLRNGPSTCPLLEYALITASEVSLDNTPPASAEATAPITPAETTHLDLPTGNGPQDPAPIEMVRLQLAPQSVNRPRLLTHADAAPQQTRRLLPTPAPTRSPFDQPSGARTQKPRSDLTPAVKTGQAPLQTPATAYDDSVFDENVLDIDEIDLTEDQDTSFEDWGKPKRLWTEDGTTRAEPLSDKRGRKRKSDEYHSDLASSHSAERESLRACSLKTVREAPGMDDQSPAQKNSATIPKTSRQDSGRSSTHLPRSIEYEEELSITETTIRTETRRSRSSAQVPLLQIPQSVTKAKRQETLSKCSQPSVDHGTEAAASESATNRIVPDSEDEDEGHNDVKKEDRTSPLRNMDYVWASDNDEVLLSPSPVKVKSVPRSSPVKHEPIPSSSPFKPPVPTVSQPQTGVDNGHNERPFPLPSPFPLRSPSKSTAKEPLTSSGAPSSTSATTSEQQKQIVRRFFGLADGDVQDFTASLEKCKKDNRDAMVAEMMEGKDVPSALQEKDRDMRIKIGAVEQLVHHSSSCRVKLHRKEDIKKRLTALVHEGQFDILNPLDEMSALTREVKRLNVELDECYAAMFDLLQQTGLPESDIFTFAVTADNFQNPPRPNVVIPSTQHARTNTISRGSPQRFTAHETNSLKSIPASPMLQTSSSRLGTSNVRRHEAPAHDPTDAAIYLSSSRRSPIRVQPSCYNAHVQSEEEHFSRRMGSPPQAFPAPEDYDNLIDDDEYMLDAAEAFEQDWSEETSLRPNIHQNRPALAETSGNSQRDRDLKTGSQFSTLKQHPWSKDVIAAMKKRFHLHGFRTNQLEAINATLSGKDAFVLMPTGGGKSLCYQLPSIVQNGRTRGVTVVISPLLSLMQDQVEHLQKLKIQAFLINSEVTAEHRKFVFQALRGPNVEQFIQLLYVTPEMLSKSPAIISIFQKLHERQRLARIVIDEAHCVSQWGHDFRPDYKALGEVRKQFPGVPVMALTATATENVKVDVIHNLGMDGCDVFSQSFNRPNLTYEVRAKGKGKEALASIADTIKTFYKGQSGIIYCLSRANCEDIATKLREDHGIKAHHYHAGMEPQEKSAVQKKWQSGEYNVIVATIAFGMGIDKADVRFVMHHTIPKSLEGYYQETGRAGRDGKRSGCYLYYGYGDTASLKRMINDGEGSWEQKERQRQMLRNVVQFCENKSDCRRVQVLAYFNEHFSRENCDGGCDNCTSGSTFEMQDFTEHAKSVVKLVRRLQKDDVTLLHCVDVYRGSKTKKITEAGHNDFEEHGLGAELERGTVERLFYRLLSEDLLEEFNRVNKSGFANSYIKLGTKCRDFERGHRQLKIQVRTSPHGKVKAKPSDKSQRKKTGTGVRAAAEAFPASTIVSSPVQAKSTRRSLRRPMALLEDSDDDEGDVSYFEPVRDFGIPAPSNKRQLGPPITIDDKLARLNPGHKHVVQDFVDTAKKQSRSIMIERNLKQQPFSDTILREMAINFPQTKEELLRIDGIDRERVELHGARFLKLIREAHNNYEAIMRAQEDRPDDPNHKNVVEISDDEDNDDDDDDDDDEDAEGEEGGANVQSSQEFSECNFDDTETSQYFVERSMDPAVKSFNAQMSQIPILREAPAKRNTSRMPDGRSSRAWSGSYRGGASGRGRGRGGKSHVRKPRGKADGAAPKKKRGSRTRTSDSSTRGNFFGSRRGGSSSTTHMGGGIGLMPT